MVPALPFQEIEVVLAEPVESVLVGSRSARGIAGHVHCGVEGGLRHQQDQECLRLLVVVQMELLLVAGVLGREEERHLVEEVALTFMLPAAQQPRHGVR